MQKNQENHGLIHHRIIIYLSIIFAVLALINIFLWYIFHFAPHIEIADILRLFDFDNEKNVPTLFNVLLLLINTYVLYAIYFFEKKTRDPRYSKWLILSALFVMMSADELFVLHEKLIDPVKNYFNTSGVFYFAWIIPVSLLVLVVVIYFLRFFLSLSKEIKRGIFIAALLYLIGAIGFEMVGGWWLTDFGDGFFYKLIGRFIDDWIFNPAITTRASQAALGAGQKTGQTPLRSATRGLITKELTE